MMNRRSAIRTYVFDLDGTLVDSIPGIEVAARAALAEQAMACVLPSLLPFIGPPIRRMLQTALALTDEKLLDRLEAAFRQHYDQGAWRETLPYAGVVDTLRTLHAGGARLYVLTNKPALPTARILEHLGWAGLFTEVVTPLSRTPAYASKTEAALELRARLRHAPQATLLVGDSPDDAAAATAAGFAFAAAAWGYGRVDVSLPAGGQTLGQFSDLLSFPPPLTP